MMTHIVKWGFVHLNRMKYFKEIQSLSVETTQWNCPCEVISCVHACVRVGNTYSRKDSLPEPLKAKTH